MKDWIEQIKALGFGIVMTYDNEGTIIAMRSLSGNVSAFKIFSGPDIDKCLADALQYARNYDAYITTAAGCNHA